MLSFYHEGLANCVNKMDYQGWTPPTTMLLGSLGSGVLPETPAAGDVEVLTWSRKCTCDNAFWGCLVETCRHVRLGRVVTSYDDVPLPKMPFGSEYWQALA